MYRQLEADIHFSHDTDNCVTGGRLLKEHFGVLQFWQAIWEYVSTDEWVCGAGAVGDDSGKLCGSHVDRLSICNAIKL